MDFQSIANSCGKPAAIIGVERTDDGLYGEIRLICANEAYKKIMGPNYHDNMIYSDLSGKELNFEDFCFRCAVKKDHLHTYVESKSLGVWTDGNYVPLAPELDDEKYSYLMFFFEFTKQPDVERLSHVSIEASDFVMQACINLHGTENFYKSMSVVNEDIQKKTDSYCSCIIMVDTEKRKFAPLCAKIRNDKRPIEEFMPFFTEEIVFSWEELLKKHDQIILKNEHDFKEMEKTNPAWVKTMRESGVKSVILVPLAHGKKLYGFLFVTNFDTAQTVLIKEFIKLTAYFLSSEIANNALMEKLEYMSNVDFLTGVRNRNSMNARVDWHVSGEMQVKAPFGILFVDLNGLKQCNDKGGHAEGDKLLKEAAELLKKHFSAYEIYRSGGDEFVVILPNCEYSVFEQKISELKAESGYGSKVCLAIGSDWSNDPKDLRQCMHIADEAMYADKNEFYNQHPDVARR